MTKFAALYTMFVRHQLTKGRMALIGGTTVIWLSMAIALRTGDDAELIDSAVFGIGDGLGFGLGVPIITLVLASASLGDLVEDETLVYVWHRPAPRWITAIAAWLASASVTVPVTALVLGFSGLLIARSFSTGVALFFAAALGSMAYCALFTLAGVLLRRSLIWGLLYVFVWEALLTRIFPGLNNLSIRAYSTSIAGQIADADPFYVEFGLTRSVVSLGVGTLVALGLTTYRLNNMDVA